jgi:hypothetical protein
MPSFRNLLSSITSSNEDLEGFVESFVNTKSPFPRHHQVLTPADAIETKPFPEGSFKCDGTSLNLVATVPVLGLELTGHQGVQNRTAITGVTYSAASFDTKDLDGLFVSWGAEDGKTLIHARIFSAIGSSRLHYLLGEWASDYNSGSLIGVQSTQKKSYLSFSSSLLDFNPASYFTGTSSYSILPLPEFNPKRGSDIFMLSASSLPDLLLQKASFSVCVTVSTKAANHANLQPIKLMTVLSTQRFGIGIDYNGCFCAWLRKPQKTSALVPVLSPWWLQSENVLLLSSSLSSSSSSTTSKNYHEICMRVDLQSLTFSLEVDGVVSILSIPVDFLQFFSESLSSTSSNSSLTLLIGADTEVAVIGLDSLYDVKVNPVSALLSDPVISDSRSHLSHVNSYQGLGMTGNPTLSSPFRPSLERVWNGSITDVAMFSGCVPSLDSRLIAWYPLRGEESLTVDASGGGRTAVLRMSRTQSTEISTDKSNDIDQPYNLLLPPFLHIPESKGAPVSKFLSLRRGIGTGWTSFAIPIASANTNGQLPSLLFSGRASAISSNSVYNQSLIYGAGLSTASKPSPTKTSTAPSTSSPSLSGGSVWLRESQNVLGGFETTFIMEIPSSTNKPISAVRLTLHCASGTWSAGAHDWFGFPSIFTEKERIFHTDSIITDNSDWVISALTRADRIRLQSSTRSKPIRQHNNDNNNDNNNNITSDDHHLNKTETSSFEFPVQLPSVPKWSSNVQSVVPSGALLTVQISLKDSSLLDVSLVALTSTAIENEKISAASMMKKKAESTAADAAVSSSSELSGDTLDAMVATSLRSPILLDDAMGVAHIHSNVPMTIPDLTSSSPHSVMQPISSAASCTSCPVTGRVIARSFVPMIANQKRLSVSVSYVQETSLLYVSINDMMCLEVIVDVSTTLGLVSANDKAMVSLSVIGPSSKDSETDAANVGSPRPPPPPPLLLIPLDAESLLIPVQNSSVLHRWDFTGKELEKDVLESSCSFCGKDVSSKTIPVAAVVINDKLPSTVSFSQSHQQNQKEKGPKAQEVFDLLSDSDNDSQVYSSSADEECGFEDLDGKDGKNDDDNDNDNDENMPPLESSDESAKTNLILATTSSVNENGNENDKLRCNVCTFDNTITATKCEMCEAVLSKIEPLTSRSSVSSVLPPRVRGSGSTTGASHSVQNSPSRNDYRGIDSHNRKQSKFSGPANLAPLVLEPSSSRLSNQDIEPIDAATEEEELQRALAMSLDPNIEVSSARSTTDTAQSTSKSGCSLIEKDNVSTSSIPIPTHQGETSEKSTKKPLSPKLNSPKSSSSSSPPPPPPPRPPLVSQSLISLAADSTSPRVQNILKVQGDWHLNIGHVFLESSSTSCTVTDDSKTSHISNNEVQVGYIVNGRFGYARPLTIPAAVVTEAGLYVPSAFAATGDSACTAQIVAGFLGPRDGGSTTFSSERGRMSLVAFANTNANPSDYKHSWRFFGSITNDEYTFAAADAEELAKHSQPIKVLRPVLSTKTPSLLTMTLSSNGVRLNGTSRNRLSRGGESKWTALKISLDEQIRPKRTNGYSGLVNMNCGLANACYANSLLQSLALTDEIRSLLLSSPLIPLTRPVAETADSSLTIARNDDDSFFPSSSLYGLFQHDDPICIGSLEDEPDALVVRSSSRTSSWSMRKGSEVDRKLAVTNRLQWLIAQLSYSQRPRRGIWAIKRVLSTAVADFRSNSQQDVVEFWSSLIDDVDCAWTSTIENSLSRSSLNAISKPTRGLFERVFCGLSATIKSCSSNVVSVCGRESIELLPMSSLIVPMRGLSFEPIVGIMVIVLPGSKSGGSTSPAVILPPGYERVDGPSISSDPSIAHVYLAVLRDPSGLSLEMNVANSSSTASFASDMVHGPNSMDNDSLDDERTSSISTPRTVLKPITDIKLFTMPRRTSSNSNVNFKSIKEAVKFPPLSWNPQELETFVMPLEANQGDFTVIPTNLRCSSSNEDVLYLGYKRAPQGSPITSIQLANPFQDIEPEGHVRLQQSIYSTEASSGNTANSSSSIKSCFLYIKRDMPIYYIAIRHVPASLHPGADLKDGWIPTKTDISKYPLAAIAAGCIRFDSTTPPANALLPAVSRRDAAGEFRICYSSSSISQEAPITDIICVPYPKEGRYLVSQPSSPKSYISAAMSLLSGSARAVPPPALPEPTMGLMGAAAVLKQLASGPFPHLMPFVQSGWELLQWQQIEASTSSSASSANSPSFGSHILIKRGEGYPIVWMDAFRGANCLSSGIKIYERESLNPSTLSASSSTFFSSLSSSTPRSSSSLVASSLYSVNPSKSTGGLNGGKSDSLYDQRESSSSSVSAYPSSSFTSNPLLAGQPTDRGEDLSSEPAFGMVESSGLGDIEVLDVSPSQYTTVIPNTPPSFLGAWEMPWDLRNLRNPSSETTSNVHSLSIESQSTAPSEGFIVDAMCGIGTRISGLLVPLQSSDTEEDYQSENFALFGMYTGTIDLKRWSHIEAIVSIPSSPLLNSPKSKHRLPPPIRISGVLHDTMEFGDGIPTATQFDAELIDSSFSPELANIGAPIVDILLLRSRDPQPPRGYVKVIDTKRKQYVKPPSLSPEGNGSSNSTRGITNQSINPPSSMSASLRPGPSRSFQATSTPLIPHEDVHLYVKRSWGELVSQHSGIVSESNVPLPIVDVCVLSVSSDLFSNNGTLGDCDLQSLSPALAGYTLIHTDPLYVDPALPVATSTAASTASSTSTPRKGMYVAIKRATRVTRSSNQPVTSSSLRALSTSRPSESSISTSNNQVWPYVERDLLLDVEVLFSDPIQFDILPGGFKKIIKTVSPPEPSQPPHVASVSTLSSSTAFLVSQDANLNSMGASSIKTHLAIRLGVPLLPAGAQCPIAGSYTVRTVKESAFLEELIGSLLNLNVRGPVPIAALKGTIAESGNMHGSTDLISSSSGGSANLMALSNSALRRFDSPSSGAPSTTAEIFQTSKSAFPRGITLGRREVAAVALPVSSAVHLLHTIETGVLSLPGIFNTANNYNPSSASIYKDIINEAWYTLGMWKNEADDARSTRRDSTSSNIYADSSRNSLSLSSSMFEIAFLRSGSTLGSGASLSKANLITPNNVPQPMVEAVGVISNPRNSSSLTFWKLHAQHVLRIVWRRDLSTLYRNGKLVESARLPRLDLNLMVSKNKSIVGNAQCEGCGNRVPLSSATIVASPPRHLLVNLLRMRFNKKIGNASKVHAFVNLPLELCLPAPSAHNLHAIQMKIVAFNNATDSEGRSKELPSSALSLPLAQSETLYGLYAIIVHKGESANSGHYFCYARRSGANLRKPDDPDAPWMLFNDDRVIATPWDAIKTHLSSSTSESAYAILYKRLDEENNLGSQAAEPELASWVKAISVDNYNVIRKLATTTSPAFLEAYLQSKDLA